MCLVTWGFLALDYRLSYRDLLEYRNLSVASIVIICSFERMAKTHTRLHGYAGWSVSMLFPCNTNRFSHDGAIENILSLKTADYRNHACFSCINICRVQRKLFDQETIRQSVQTSPKGLRKC